MQHIYTYISIILLLAVNSPSLSAQDIPPTAPTEATPPPPPPSLLIEGREVFKVVDVMPRFPGCEYKDFRDQAKKKCADGKLLKYVYKNLKYPKSAKKEGIEGIVVISFIVTRDGHISNADVKRAIGGGLDSLALEMVNNMNNLKEKWTPGTINGEAVDAYYILPIKFKL